MIRDIHLEHFDRLAVSPFREQSIADRVDLAFIEHLDDRYSVTAVETRVNHVAIELKCRRLVRLIANPGECRMDDVATKNRRDDL
jgi:hypothetical protein